MGLQKKQNRASGEVPELGAIFMCNRATKKLCFTWKTFGLPSWKEGFVRQVKAGMFLFLFEYETRKLYGVYQAWSDGEMNLSSEAFSSTGNKYPAQVHFKVLWYCKPLSEDEFRPAIKHNYFAPYKFNFGLTKNQVMKLLWLFNSRKLRDELLLERMLPSDPSFSRGTTREEFPFRAENECVPENANDLELNKNLKNIFIPNGEVHGRLLIDGDRDIGRECADTVRPSSNYRMELSHRDRVIQVRDNTDYGYNSNNDYDLNSGVPFLSTDEKYDPDIPLFEDLPVTQQPQRYDEENGPMCGGGVDADNSVDGRLEEDEVPNFTRYFQPTISNSRAPHPAYFDNPATEGSSSYNPDSGTSLQGCGRYSKVRLNPDFFRGLNNSINVEPLKPLSENILLPSETDNASILRQPVAYYDPSQTISHPITTDGHFQIGVGIESFDPDHYEGALQHSSAGGRTHDWETIVPSFCMKDISNPVDVNEDSKVCKERKPVSQNKHSVFSRLKPAVDAGDESKLKDSQRSIDDMVNEVMDKLKGHYCQLIRGFSSMTKQVDDDDNKSKIKKHQSWPSQAAKCESVAPLEMGFDLSSANEGCESQSDSQIIGEMPRLNFKRRSEVQKTRNLAEGGLAEMSSAILVDRQSKRRKLVRPTFSDKKLSNADAVLDNISVKFTLSGQSFQDGSFNTDVPLPCDNAQNSSEAGNLGSGLLFAANADMGVGSDYEKREKDERVEMSTKIELGGSLNDSDFHVVAGVGSRKLQLASVANAADNRSDKSVGLDGSPQDSPNDLDRRTKCFIPVKNEDTEDRIMGLDRVHEESNNTLLAEGTSAIVQATQVQYFEFFK